MKTFLRFAFPALLLSSLASAQDLSQKITYEAGGIPAKRAIEELSKLSNVPMATAPLTANEIVVIRVKDAPLTDLMKKLAEATSGAWTQEGELWRLGADNGKRNAQAAAEHQKRVAAMQKALDQLLKPPAKGEGEPNRTMPMPGVMMGMGGVDPASKAVVTILGLGRISANTLASIPEGGRIVFSSNPTRMQLPINFDVRPLVNNLIQQHNKHVETLKEAEANRPPRTKEEEQMEEWASAFGGVRKPQLITGGASKLLLVASRNGFMDGVTLQLKLFDDKGNVAVTGTQTLMVDAGMFEEFAEMMPGAPPKQAKPAEPDKAIEFSDRTKKLMGFFKTMSNPMVAPSKEALSKDLIAILLRPDEHDPLSFVHGEAILAVAKEKNLQTVASLPDSLMSVFGMMFSSDKYTINAYLKRLEKGDNTTVETKDGWLVIRPAQPAEARQKRTDRVALSQFIRLANDKGIPSLEDFGAYALKSESPMESPASMMYLMFFAPNTINQGFGGMTNWDMLRLYGTMSVGQRQGLEAGGRLDFGTLSQQQKHLVSKLVFGAAAHLEPLVRDEEKKDVHPFFEMARSWMPNEGRDLRDEPTEVMPNGLPGNGSLRMTVDRGYFTMVASDQSAGPASMFGGLGADELAMLRYFKEDPQFSAFAGFMPAMDKFRLGQRETLNFTFYVAPEVVMKETLKNDRMDKDAKVVAYNDLPGEFKEKVDKRLDVFKKNPLPFGQMMGGGFRPPAP